jgi:hypothetical protein
LSVALAAAALAVAATWSPAAPTARYGPPAWRPGMHAAATFARRRRGVVAFAIGTPTRYWGWHDLRTYPSASVLKAMLLVAYLERDRHHRLSHTDRARLEPMIRRSDNSAATTVIGIVGARGLRSVAARAHMHRFTPVTGIWGNSRIDARDQERFFLHIDRLVPRRHRAYAMRLLATVVPSQRWGVGQVGPRGWRLYFKGGWGSGTGAIDHQVALLVRGSRRVSLAILTASDGSHAYGKATLRGVAARLLRGLDRDSYVP